MSQPIAGTASHRVDFSSMEWNISNAMESFANVDEVGRLRLVPPAGLDYWQKTYYTPLLVKHSGPFCSVVRYSHKVLTLETEFAIEHDADGGGGGQFDQGGLMVMFDEHHWLKTGIEVVDNVPRLSCVVTNGGYSDWSTQRYDGLALRLRVSQMGDGAYVVEALLDSAWQFIRICHLTPHLQQTGNQQVPVRLGVFACCPVAQNGTTVVFDHFLLRDGVEFQHDAN